MNLRKACWIRKYQYVPLLQPCRLHCEEEIEKSQMDEPVVADSVTQLDASAAGRVVVGGSHGGVYAGLCPCLFHFVSYSLLHSSICVCPFRSSAVVYFLPFRCCLSFAAPPSSIHPPPS
eukprot:3798332-Rhodomonas_salina.2